MIYVFAYGLDVGHPAAYALVAVLVGIPLLEIVVLLIDKWRNE